TVGLGTSTKKIGRLVRNIDKAERGDIRNRLLSIALDAQFISELVGLYRKAGCHYPLFANLRNGRWYGKAWDGTCYFKSTDGHSRRRALSSAHLDPLGPRHAPEGGSSSPHWAFSYTRLNLHLAAAAAEHGGCIVVDSTRSGKRFPDSFTSTIPIWCAVLNRLVAEDRAREGQDWDVDLHTPRWLSPSEAAQIKEKLDGWVEGLGGARASLQGRLARVLRKPLRPVWLCPDGLLLEGMLPAWDAASLTFTPVICVSASKLGCFSEAVTSREAHRQRHSWVYVQGAGDDEEQWCRGLTPEAFWSNSDALLG
ncbi:unnamed protein product, partial [Discosporangium mesarthrocarpum]